MKILEENKNRPKKTIVLEYYEDDLCEVWSYQKFIKKHINGKGVNHLSKSASLLTFYTLQICSRRIAVEEI